MKKIEPHLQYFWWIYLLIAVFFVSLWCIVFSSLGQPEDNERLVFSYFGSDFDYSEMNADISKNISEITSSDLKSTAFAFVCTEDEPLIMQLIQARLCTSDVLVITENILSEELAAGNFNEIPEEIIEKYLAGAELYYAFGKPYGIILTPEAGENNFSVNYSGEERCIAFLCPDSANLGGIYGKGEEKDDAALCVIKYLLEIKE